MTRVGVRTSFPRDPARRESLLADVAALSTKGVTGVRLRIGWAEMFPSEGRPDGRLFDELGEFVSRIAATGAEVWPTLCGNRLPGWFLNEGAFADTKATDRFWSQYVDTVASTIADVASGWIPFETPVALLHDGWRAALRDPGIADEAKFADAFGGVVNALASVARLLTGATLQLSIDALHAGATNEVVEVFREAVLRGRLALPGRVVREISGLQGSYSDFGLAFPDRTPFASGDAMRRWRDTTVAVTYATAERFSPLGVSITSIPDAATDVEHADIVDTVRGIAAEVRDGGAELRWVWLGDAAAVAGLVATDGQAFDL
jgi:hypothetical protein